MFAKTLDADINRAATEKKHGEKRLLKVFLVKDEFRMQTRYEIHHNQHYQSHVCNFSSLKKQKSACNGKCEKYVCNL